MRTIEFGKDPDIAVVAGVHGDEPSGVEAIENLVEEANSFRKPVKFIVANEKALEKAERFLDADLNRSFPGDPESSLHEKRLAARLSEELQDVIVLDLHSTTSIEEPHAITVGQKEKLIELAASTGLSQVVDMSYVDGGLGNSVDNVVTVEVSRGSTNQAREVIENFLAAEGVIEASFERGSPEIYETFGTTGDGEMEFRAENFSKVEKGEVFGIKKGEKLVATEAFYPVLMSTDGYDSMLGFKAKKVSNFRQS